MGNKTNPNAAAPRVHPRLAVEVVLDQGRAALIGEDFRIRSLCAAPSVGRGLLVGHRARGSYLRVNIHTARPAS